MDFNNMQSMDNDDARSVTSVRTDDGLGIDTGRATPDFFSDSEDDITDVSPPCLAPSLVEQALKRRRW